MGNKAHRETDESINDGRLQCLKKGLRSCLTHGVKMLANSTACSQQKMGGALSIVP